MFTRGRARVVVIVIFIAVAALTTQHFFRTAWSNHCDPGNAQFNLLESDPVVSSRFQGDLFVWQNDGPDNGWFCSNPSLSISHVGDASTLFPEVKADMVEGHWTELAPVPNENVAVYQKDTPQGVRLSAVVRSQPFWVEVDLDAPGLHPGENGFN